MEEAKVYMTCWQNVGSMQESMRNGVACRLAGLLVETTSRGLLMTDSPAVGYSNERIVLLLEFSLR